MSWVGGRPWARVPIAREPYLTIPAGQGTCLAAYDGPQTTSNFTITAVQVSCLAASVPRAPGPRTVKHPCSFATCRAKNFKVSNHTSNCFQFLRGEISPLVMTRVPGRGCHTCQLHTRSVPSEASAWSGGACPPP